MMRPVLTVVLGCAAAVAAAGCASTQDRSAQLQKEGAKLILNQHGLTLHGRNADVRVLHAGVVTDANGTAAAVQLRNSGRAPVGPVPIAIDVLGSARKVVFANNAPGLEPALVSVAAIPPKGEITWVDDQVIPTGRAVAVRARVGAGGTAAPRQLPQIDVGPVHISSDATSGLEASGTVTNRSAITQLKLFVFVFAWRGTALVSAGRGAIARLPAHRHATYHVFPIGNPKGAQLTAVAPPTVLR